VCFSCFYHYFPEKASYFNRKGVFHPFQKFGKPNGQNARSQEKGTFVLNVCDGIKKFYKFDFRRICEGRLVGGQVSHPSTKISSRVAKCFFFIKLGLVEMNDFNGTARLKTLVRTPNFTFTW
jgi:hypothetical protein